MMVKAIYFINTVLNFTGPNLFCLIENPIVSVLSISKILAEVKPQHSRAFAKAKAKSKEERMKIIFVHLMVSFQLIEFLFVSIDKKPK